MLRLTFFCLQHKTRTFGRYTAESWHSVAAAADVLHLFRDARRSSASECIYSITT